MKGTIFSIGHSQHDLDYFISLLKSHKINYVLDVRSQPYSRFAMEYNKESIQGTLEKSNIKYAFMGESFGARQMDRSLYSQKGYLDFEKVACGIKFRRAFDNVVKGVEQGNKIAFMCTEKDPIECHRAILVTNAFYNEGFMVEHIMPDNSIQTQQEVNRRLLDMYYPTRNQLSLFETNNLTEEQYLVEAYKKQNEKIGYYLEGKKLGIV